MAYLKTKVMKTAMVFIVFFSAIAPVYGSVITPAIKDFATGTQKKNIDGAMPCHKNKSHHKTKKFQKNKQTPDQSACFKHCLQYLNDPCLASIKPEVKAKSNKQTSIKYFIQTTQDYSSTNITGPSNKDPPKQIDRSGSDKGLSTLLLNTSRLRR